MANLGDIFTMPATAPTPAYTPVIGGGSGGSDIVSALLLASVLGNGGLGNRNGNNDGIGIEGLNNLKGCIESGNLASAIGDVKASVPLAEGQVQLALAGLGDQLTRTITNGQTALTQNQFAMQLQEANSTAAVQAQLAANTATVLTNLNSVDTNVDRSATAIINAVRDDGNATRALITDNLIHGLRDDKVILANELAELRNERNRDRDRHGVEVTMINNQNQNQQQFQQQAQVLNTLSHGLVDALQSIRATNQAINIGGTQTANPLNSNTNVKG